VPFKPEAAASVEEAKPPSSPGVELETMIRARSTALAALHGTTQPVNPVALPASLIGQDGYLMYLLAGTKRPAVAVFGKHYRRWSSVKSSRTTRSRHTSSRVFSIAARMRDLSKP
jgi:hypothetical protein